MAWNEPGGSGKNPDPWGGNKNNQQPPDLDKLIKQFIQKLQTLFKSGPKLPGTLPPVFSQGYSWGLGVILAVILAIWVLAGFFIVNPAEQGVILRLGKYSDTVNPGLHWMARFIDTKYLVDVRKIYSFSLQNDFLTKSSEQGDLPNPYAVVEKNVPVVPLDKSGADRSKNVVNVELTVQYRIADPRAYLFNVVNPDDTIQQVAAGALSDVIGKMKLDEVLTTGRESLSLGVLEKIKHVLQTYNAGLEVVAVTLRKVQAPDQVRAAFNDVNRADQEKATYIQQAQAYASKVVPLAQGVAARILADANAYQQQVVLGAQAEIAKYQALLSVYKTSPDLTRERMYIETMQTVFENTSKILVDVNGSNNMLYLPIDKLVQSVKAEDITQQAVNNTPTPYSNLSAPINAAQDQSTVSTETNDGSH
ncbi:MAG: FtsH protease activity modulator HflK [Gammaproteobacteria bacterium]|nr:FtsH protease activity modulator HflK [Gammaproteobacteria bacterium]